MATGKRVNQHRRILKYSLPMISWPGIKEQLHVFTIQLSWQPLLLTKEPVF